MTNDALEQARADFARAVLCPPVGPIALALDELERAIETIEGEFGSGRDIAQMRDAESPDVLLLDAARDALSRGVVA